MNDGMVIGIILFVLVLAIALVVAFEPGSTDLSEEDYMTEDDIEFYSDIATHDLAVCADAGRHVYSTRHTHTECPEEQF